jgi:hypothetical protein
MKEKIMSETSETKEKETISSLPHPIQPIGWDGSGVVRWKHNPIVRYLLDTHPNCTMNDIAVLPNIDRQDHEQFAQLIGYSHSGSADLSYMSDEVLDTAERIFEAKENGEDGDDKDHQIQALRAKVEELTGLLKDIADKTDMFREW